MMLEKMRLLKKLKVLNFVLINCLADSKIIYSLQWSKDGKYLAVSDYIGTIKLFETVNFTFVDST